MKSTKHTSETRQPIGWRLSDQHQLALALLASFALALIVVWFGWSAWQRKGDIDQARPIRLEFKVDINQAELGELMAIPSVGPKMAEAIVRYRDQQGRLGTLDQLLDVPGIGPKKLLQLKRYLLPIKKSVAGLRGS